MKAIFINELTMCLTEETDQILFPYQYDKIHLQAVTEQSEGRTLLIDDTALKERFFEERSFLKEGLRSKHVGRSRSGYLQSAYGRSVVLDNGDQYARVRSRTNIVLNWDLVK